jgi:glutamate dehydrogenase (NADP+)
LGGKVVTCSDSDGYIYDEEGIDEKKLGFIIDLKNVKRGRIKTYAEKYKKAVYTPVDRSKDYNPLWDHKADCAFPSATQKRSAQKTRAIS